MSLNGYVAQLIEYAKQHLELSARDEVYARNRVMDILGLYDYNQETVKDIPELPDSILEGIFACLEEMGVEFDHATLGEKLMDAVMLKPSEHEARFNALYEESPQKATEWANAYAIHSDYVKKSAIDKNIRWNAKNGLEITINLSKPEKNNKDLQKQLTVASTSYPKCIICPDNEGYQKPGFSRRNMRTLSMKLYGKEWFWQYSPYAYFNEHGIAISVEHTPMVLDDDTVELLFDFVEQFPHYFIGNNAPLPRVGGSILMHNHFQGGNTVLPMQKAGYRKELHSAKYSNVKVGVLDWYNTALRLEGADRCEIKALAMDIVNAWKTYENDELDILSYTDKEPHNTASCIARKTENGYILDMILRNNRVNEVHPDGIFHAHREHHHIKSESIGLIEAMGLFILPARLKRQLAEIKNYLTGTVFYKKDKLSADMQIFAPMIEHLLDESGTLWGKQADNVIRTELERVCQNILDNTAVFKNDEKGQNELLSFMKEAGLDD